ncbi:MAG: tyrosine--tRNA ligase [Candidatus Pacearchaeota archaeon]|nr:tyrosine--tRNA ligase [Candidatus Pacearchaeota archaeon]
MDNGELDIKRLNLIERNVVEFVTKDELVNLLLKKKNPVVYCGYEPSGPIHLGHFVTITKLMDLERAGFNVIILLADIHALLNRKGNEKEIAREVARWKKTIKAIGLKAKIVLGSDFQFKKNYQMDVMSLAQELTINRGLRSMQEVARDIENATISQLWYPIMQAVDIKHLKVDVALGGMEQRKIHMMAKDMKKTLGWDFVAMHTPLICSLKGPGQKMSKSIPGSGISLIDSDKEIEEAINGAYCPIKIVEDNPILQIARLIIFPRFERIRIEREKKFGGDLELVSADELEGIYSSGELHPMDLKKSVANYLEKIIVPIRKNYQ